MIPPLDERGSSVNALEALTLAARDAAEQGRWDIVEEYYHRRGKQLLGLPLLPQETELLLRIDRTIQERISVVQAALISVLQESACVQQRLEGLRQGIGVKSLSSGTILMEA